MIYCCQRCNRPIPIDTIVPDDLWLRISPRGDEGGLLCAACIIDKLSDLDLGRAWASARLVPAHDEQREV